MKIKYINACAVDARQVLRDNYANHCIVVPSSFRWISEVAAGKSFPDLLPTLKAGELFWKEKGSYNLESRTGSSGISQQE